MRLRLIVGGGIMTLAVSYLLTREVVDLPQIFGDKQVSMFDLWTPQHFMSGVVLGRLMARRSSPMLSVLAVGFLFWEAPEWWLEAGGLGDRVASWKAGQEHWANRLIGDPLAIFLGARLYFRAPRIFWPSFVVATLWLVLNVTSPNCMTIQQKLLAIVFP